MILDGTESFCSQLQSEDVSVFGGYDRACTCHGLSGVSQWKLCIQQPGWLLVKAQNLNGSISLAALSCHNTVHAVADVATTIKRPCFTWPPHLKVTSHAWRRYSPCDHKQDLPYADAAGERESLHLSSHTGLMQVLPGHPLADPRQHAMLESAKP